MKTKKTTEQALLILQNDASFQVSFSAFASFIQQGISEGFAFHGHPLQLSENETRAYCDRMSFRNDLPVELKNAGYRVEQFGTSFLACGALSFSAGTNVCASLRDKITGAIRRCVGYNESLQYPINNAFLALLSTLVTPNHAPQ